MLKIDVGNGRFHIRHDYRETSSGEITGSHVVGGQLGHFTYRNAAHYLEYNRVEQKDTFTVEEVALMERARRWCETRGDFDRLANSLAEAEQRFHADVAALEAEIARRPVPLTERSLRRTVPRFDRWDDDYWSAVLAACESALDRQRAAWAARFS